MNEKFEKMLFVLFFYDTKKPQKNNQEKKYVIIKKKNRSYKFNAQQFHLHLLFFESQKRKICRFF